MNFTWMRANVASLGQMMATTPPLPNVSPVADAAKPAARDRSHVLLDSPTEVSNWTQDLGVDEGELRGAIAAVGTGIREIRHYLGV